MRHQNPAKFGSSAASSRNNNNFAAAFRVYAKNQVWVTDMYYKLDGEEDGELSYGDFILLLIKELQVKREHGYVRLFLYPRKVNSESKCIAIFIRKRDIYVVGVQDSLGNVYEVGKEEDGERYFYGSQRTGFGQQYSELFGDGNLHGLELGYKVLDNAIMRVIRNPNTLDWAWSIGIFALMWSECARFVWFYDVLIIVMANKESIKMRGPKYSFMSVLPKIWSEISLCARRHPLEDDETNEPQPVKQKYTRNGALRLQYVVRWAIDSLFIQTWQYGRGDGGGGYGRPDGSGGYVDQGSGVGRGGGCYGHGRGHLNHYKTLQCPIGNSSQVYSPT